jgi:hypothetical protein
MEKLQQLAADVIYEDNGLFTLLESLAMKRFLKAICPQFWILCATDLRNKYLDSAYNTSKQELSKILDGLVSLVYSCDGSTNNCG